MGYNKKNATKKVKIAIQQLNGSWSTSDDKPVELLPELAIRQQSGNSVIYCYSVVDKGFVKITRGQKAFLIDELKNTEGKSLVYTWDGYLIEIDTTELLYTGFD
jgi:hypothetical protein